MDESDIVTKGRFAEICGVSPARVSQWISERKISGAALVGEGRSARVCVSEAKAQLDRSLDLTQRLGANGKAKIAATVDPSMDVRGDRPAGLDEQIRKELLEQRRIETRRMLREEATTSGDLVSARDARLATNKVVERMLTAVDQAVIEMASALSAEYSLSKRDVEHLLRRVWREKRTKQAEGFAIEVAEIPPDAELTIELQ